MQLDSKDPHQGQTTPRPFDLDDRKMFAAKPPSERTHFNAIYILITVNFVPPVLSRVQAFLPELAASNAELARKAKENPDSVDIENVDDQDRYIEMVSQFFIHSLTPETTSGFRTWVSAFSKVTPRPSQTLQVTQSGQTLASI